MGKPWNLAICNHVQALLPKHLRDPYQGIWFKMGRQGNRLHYKGDNHSKFQPIQDEIPEGLLWHFERVQKLFDIIYEREEQRETSDLTLNI